MAIRGTRTDRHIPSTTTMLNLQLGFSFFTLCCRTVCVSHRPLISRCGCRVKQLRICTASTDIKRSKKALWDIGHAPKDGSNRRKRLPDYAVWEIHPAMRLEVLQRYTSFHRKRFSLAS